MNTNLSIDVEHWNRRLLNTYWIFIILITITELITVAAFNSNRFNTSLIRFVVIPTLGISLVMVAAEIVVRYMKSMKEYAISLVATVMATVIIYIHSDIRSVAFAYALPALVAMSYLNKKLIITVTIANISSFLLTYYTNSYLNKVTKPFDIIATVFILLICASMAIKTMERGLSIQRTLLKTQKESQELLIKNTLMDKLIKIDALTELYNHMTFHEYLDRLIEQNHINNLSLQLALIDIDDFKKVNDIFGHRVGDIVLKRIADVIKDSIDPNDFAARYGGEEFAILFTEKSVQESYAILENIRVKIAGIKHDEISNSHVTVSIGLQEYQKNGKEKLFSDADQALYDSKRNGKNQTRQAA